MIVFLIDKSEKMNYLQVFTEMESLFLKSVKDKVVSFFQGEELIVSGILSDIKIGSGEFGKTLVLTINGQVYVCGNFHLDRIEIL